MRTEQRIRSIEHDGLVLDVIDEGPIGGEPVVLLHGWPERATVWRRVTPLLNDAGYRTLAMDRRGFAPGARPPRRRDYRLPELAGDVAALIDAAGGDAHVVGHDWGAATAWATAGYHPEKVRTLTAVSVAHPAAFMKAMVRSDQALRSWYMALFNLPYLPELALRSGWADRVLRRAGMTPDGVRRFRREIVDDGALSTSLGCYRGVLLMDPREIGFRVVAPTTMVWSTGDSALGRWGPEHSGEYVDAPFELAVLDGVSHWIPTEAPDTLADLILARVGA